MKPRVKVMLLAAAAGSALALAAPAPAPAGLDEDRGLAIAVEADRRDAGFGDYSAELQMALRNRHGEESTRTLRVWILEQANDGDKSLTVFDHPPDVRGTSLLTFSHKTGDDDQWLYLPAMKRVKRISTSNKSGPFMGSEFAYEDISSSEVEEYTYRYLTTETLDGQEAFVIERRPAYAKSGYTKQVVWIDTTGYRTLRIDFYDRKDDLLKTLTYGDYQQYLGRHWRAGRMSMVNHQTGKSTDLSWRHYTFRNGLNERDFDQASLARKR